MLTIDYRRSMANIALVERNLFDGSNDLEMGE
jgi:hypothetical protein